MNYQRLNELAAKAMGWHYMNKFSEFSQADAWCSDEAVQRPIGDWNPSTCADDALTLLEHVVEGWGYWTVAKCSGCYVAKIDGNGRLISDEAETAPLAITICALRATGIPLSEITAAMKDEKSILDDSVNNGIISQHERELLDSIK